MAAGPMRAVRNLENDAAVLDLECLPQPVVIIDIEAAEMLAANKAGREAFGLFPYASFPLTLEPTIPALKQLRALVTTEGPERLGPQTLTFRKNGAPLPLICSVSRYGNTNPSQYVIRVEHDDHDVAENSVETQMPPLEQNDANGERPAVTETNPAPQRSEAATLHEIARQISDATTTADTQNTEAAAGDVANDGSADGTDALPATEPMAPPAEPAPRTPVRVLDPDHLAKLAHELKTPLTAIAAAAEVMRDERLGQMGNARYLGYAADIHESATHALDVITSLLADSRKPEGAVPRLVTLDLNALVARTVSSLQALADARGLTLAFDADESTPHVIANPTSLRQILLNLLTNAIKFTPSKGDVRAVTGYLNDGRVFLVVRDTGCGMGSETTDDQDAEQPGDPQLGKHGNGIGLPLVERLVRDMGGDIEIDSAPGKGTVVLVAFGGFARWSQ